MHFVTGGAFHGKKQWVIDHYQINDYQINETTNYLWFNGYKSANKYFQVMIELENKQLLVIEAVNEVIFEMLKSEASFPAFENWLQEILTWEQNGVERQVVFIGTDVGKGIVPIEKEQRLIRDEVGRCFQLLAKKATNVSLIWYGLQQSLK
ncbi:bifunctional adenosylcobinamide kinase/adenosylcobinamide-phosphate guanylyltransferase [Bacillaceae bacterium IKA-2]|nr:bifunctional adenosylcobinamide kinase/adenosylcobinamide-phosphate guanylyltransferase [Bacillaceae bacterium IKA-2]